MDRNDAKYNNISMNQIIVKIICKFKVLCKYSIIKPKHFHGFNYVAEMLDFPLPTMNVSIINNLMY